MPQLTRSRIIFSIGILVIAALYYRTLDSRLFFLDDLDLLLAPQVSGSLGLRSIQSIITPGNSPDFYPVRDLSYVLDLAIFGQSRFWFRVDQLFLFLQATLLNFFIIRRISKSEEIACAATLLWALNPIHTEMVIWIAARKDLLAMVFALYSSSFFLMGSDRQDKKLLVASFISFILSILSKSSFVLLPFAALLYLRLFRRSKRTTTRFVLVACLVSIASSLSTSWYYSEINDMRWDYPWTIRIASSAAALGKLALGWFDSSLNIVDPVNWGNWVNTECGYAWFGALLWMTLGAFSFRALLRKDKRLIFVCAGALLLYLPTSGLAFPHRNFYSVRYLEPLFLFLVMAFSSNGFPMRWPIQAQRLMLPAALILVGYFALQTLSEVDLWADPIQVVNKAARDQPSAIRHKAFQYLALTSLSKDNPNGSLITLRQEITQALDKICSADVDEKDALECSNYWSAKLADSNGEPPDVRAALLQLAVKALSKYERLYPWALTSELGYGLSLGTITDSLMRDWRANRHGLITPESRMLNWVVECFLFSPKSAEELIASYVDRHLLRQDSVERFIQNFVHPAYRARLKGCLPMSARTALPEPHPA